jgi:hypothetical protein
MAILAGIVAQVLEDLFGHIGRFISYRLKSSIIVCDFSIIFLSQNSIYVHILITIQRHAGPFQGAIALTALALLLVMRWEENYGEEDEGGHGESSLYSQFIDGWKTTISDSFIWRIGMTQALSEGAMYTVSETLYHRRALLILSEITQRNPP